MSRADVFLSRNGYYDSRARAAAAIKAGKVTVNGRTLKKPSEKIPEDADIQAGNEHPWVSRGGIKLDHALRHFGIEPKGLVCLDVGASTGGFCDVLLNYGASKIYAVDVGSAQLHPKLRDENRIISLENTDARSLTTDMFDPLPDLLVFDVSFISVTKVLAYALACSAKGAAAIILVKPQFEVGPEGIGRGGIVKSEALSEAALVKVQSAVKDAGWAVLGTTLSPIKGGSGNTEFLLHARQK